MPRRIGRRAGVGVLAALVAMAGVLGYRAWAERWPARLVLGSAPGERLLGFSPDGAVLATSDDRAGIAVWDVVSGRRRATWAVPDRVVVMGEFAPDGRTLAAVTRHNDAPAEVILVDVATGRVRSTAVVRYDRPSAFGYSADGAEILLGSDDRTGLREVVRFDAATGVEVGTARPTPGPPGTIVLAITGGRYLANFPPNGGPITLDPVGPGPARPPIRVGATTAGASGAMAITADGRRFALGRLDGTIEVWDVATGTRLETIRAHAGRDASGSLYFSPDGRTLISDGWRTNGGPTGLAFVLSIELGRLRDYLLGQASRPNNYVVIDVETGRITARSGDPYHLLFAPDGRTVATTDRDQRIRLRELPPR